MGSLDDPVVTIAVEGGLGSVIVVGSLDNAVVTTDVLGCRPYFTAV